VAREIQPEGEPLTKAIRWIGEARLEHPDARVPELIDAASIRFDLTPLEEEFLWEMLVPAHA
jgi:hypothetical protein